MPLKARGVVLTKSHAACLTSLRNGKVAKPEIAILAKLDLPKTAAALGTLEQLGLVKQNRQKHWHATRRGKSVASRSFQIDCVEIAEIQGPADNGCSTC